MEINDIIRCLEDMAEDLEDEIDEGYGTNDNVRNFEALQMSIGILQWVKEEIGIIDFEISKEEG